MWDGRHAVADVSRAVDTLYQMYVGWSTHYIRCMWGGRHVVADVCGVVDTLYQMYVGWSTL